MFDTFHGAQFLDELFQTGGVFEHHDEIATEQAVVGVDVDRAQHQSLILGDDTREIVHDTDIIGTDHTQGDGVLRGPFPTPSGFHHTIAIATTQLRRIGTVLTVDLDAAVDRHEAEDRIAIDGMAAACQLVVETFEVTIDHQRVVRQIGVEI